MTRSTLRLLLLAGVMIVALNAFAPYLLAQDASAPAVDPAADKPGTLGVVVNLVLGNIDFIFVVIGILSVLSLGFIIQGFVRTRPSVIMPEESTNQIREMIGNRQFQELIEFTENDTGFISKVVNPALKRAPNYSHMKEAMEIAIAEQSADSFRKLEILNIIGNLGPLLGLMGTVLGMMIAFDDMNRAKGNADPALLAGGISKALAHTFLGLFLAIPSLAAYGILRSITDKLITRASIISEELLQMMRPSETKAAAPARPQVATTRQ